MDGAEAAIEFYKKAFNATETLRMTSPENGKIMHAEIRIGDSPIMMGNEMREMGYLGPKAHGGTPVSLYLYVKDVDSLFKQAIEAGAVEQRPVADQFYGDRMGTLIDPFGHVWHLSTHIKDMSYEEMKEAMPTS
nr:glyoxalase family protein [uncultured bacterium]